MSDEFYQMVKGVSEAASQPLCKLIDAVRAGTGLIYEPTHIRRIAKAEADALVIQEQCELTLSDLRHRAAARLTFTETRRQQNIEHIVEKASQQLPEKCSEEPVDSDWIANFFDCCKDIGNEEVQSLWGKLLAGEIAEPGSYSRCALNALKLMNSAEAAIFMVIGFRVWRLDGWPVLLIPGKTYSTWPKACPFTWSHISALADIDLLHPHIRDEEELIGQKRGELTFDYFGHRFAGFTNPLGGISPSWVAFTRLGFELLPLVEQKAGIHDEYLDACDQCFSRPNWKLDNSSEFRELIVPDDLRESLNLNDSSLHEGQDA